MIKDDNLKKLIIAAVFLIVAVIAVIAGFFVFRIIFLSSLVSELMISLFSPDIYIDGFISGNLTNEENKKVELKSRFIRNCVQF